MSLLDINELIRFAVKIEENGEMFYRQWAGQTSDPVHKKLFSRLADEEVKHKEIFSVMLNKVASQPSDGEAYEYYSAYLKTYADDILFNSKKYQQQINNVKTIGAAIDFAIQREVDSILFYQELKNFIPIDQEKIINDIIDEERKHFVELNKIRTHH